MSGLSRSSDGLDDRRKRLLFRSWHRGIKEMDLVLGPFAEQKLEELTDAQLDEYEVFLEINDHDLFKWLSGRAPVPEDQDTEIYRIVKQFSDKMTF